MELLVMAVDLEAAAFGSVVVETVEACAEPVLGISQLLVLSTTPQSPPSLTASPATSPAMLKSPARLFTQAQSKLARLSELSRLFM
jgi:hypothetical protein